MDPTQRSELEARRAEMERQRAHEQALEEAREARAEHLAAVVRRKVTKGDALQLLVRTVASLAYIDVDELEHACDILNIEVDSDDGYPDYSGRLGTYMQASDDNVARAAIAMSFALTPGAVTGCFGCSLADAGAHIDYLVKRGYALTDAERQELEGADEPDAADDSASPAEDGGAAAE